MLSFNKRSHALFSIILSVVIIATILTGCGTADKNESEKPLIGISWRADTDSEFFVNVVEAVRAAGGVPVLLPQVMHEDLEYDRDNVLRNASDEQGALTAEIAELLKNDGYIKSNAADIVGDVDAVIFTGGEDISSQLYAIPEPWHGIEEEIDYNATRDSNDFMLMDYCLDNNIPVLGICRGMQMLAIVSGAKIIQDIPTFMSELGVVYSYEHRNVKGTPDSYRDYAPHDVNIKEGSLAHKFSSETLIQSVPSWHHQAIASTEGTNLEVTGTLNVNGVEMIEIVERTDKDFAVGIQYHPEAVIDKSMDCQTNASDYMSYEDALEVFTYLIELVRRSSIDI